MGDFLLVYILYKVHKFRAHSVMSMTTLGMVSERVRQQQKATLDIFLMAVRQITNTLNRSVVRSTRRLVLPRTQSKPACRAANMTPVNAGGNNVVFFEHLFLGVSDVAVMFKYIL